MFITATSIRRLIKELELPLISAWDPRLTNEQWLEEYPCAESQEAIIKVQESFFDDERYIEGSKFDLTLDRIEIRAPDDDTIDFMGIDNQRRNHRTVEAPCEDDVYHLLPGHGYHAITKEFVNMPGFLMGLPHAKMGLLQSNVGFFCSLVPPGFSGTLMFLLHAIDSIYTIKKGSPVASIAFGMFMHDDFLTGWQERGVHQIIKETDPYKGPRGGKVHGTQGEIWSAS